MSNDNIKAVINDTRDLAATPFKDRGEGAAATQERETITVEKKDWLELPRNITLKRFVNTRRETHFIGQYRDDKNSGNTNPRRVYEINVVPLAPADLMAIGIKPAWEVSVREDDKRLFKITTQRGRAVAEYLGVKALKAWLNYCGKQSRKTHCKRNRANRRARKAAANNPVNPVNPVENKEVA